MKPPVSRRLATFGRIGVLLAGLLFLYAPIAVLIAYSFNASRLSMVWTGFSTRWYANLAVNEPVQAAALVSLRAAFVSACLATALGLASAVALTRFGAFRGRSLFFGALLAPIVLPEIVLGLSLLLTYVALGWPRGFWTLVAGHTTFALGFATMTIRARLAEVDPALEEAARDLGANPAQAFADVVLPQIGGALAAAFFLAFILSMDDVVIASFTAGPGSTTLPMRIYSQARLGISPEINAISTLLLAAATLLLAAAALISFARGRPAREQREA